MGLRFPPRFRVLAAILLAGLLAGGLWVFLRFLDQDWERAADLDRIVVETTELSSPDLAGVTLWLHRAAPVDVEPFGGHVYAASASGLEVFDPDGRRVRRYTALDGLPENSLTCLERYGDRLFIGTRESGLLAFDGRRFTRYRFVRPEARHVTALSVAQGELLVGTFDGGLFEFDGGRFTRRYASSEDGCRQVTALLESGPRVFIGTFADGVFEWREGALRRVGTAEGLPSARVTGLAARGRGILVATDLGVAELDEDGRATVVDSTPNTTGVAASGEGAWVSSLGRGVLSLRPAGLSLRAVADRLGLGTLAPSDGGLPTRGVLGVTLEDGALWAMTDSGLFVCEAPGAAARFLPFGEEGAQPELSGGHVAALALDARGRLWVGYFDGGIDVVDPSTGRRLERIDDAIVREVNAIVADPTRDRVWVGASKGLAVYDGGRRARVVGEREGLVGANVAAVAVPVDETAELAVATSKGVSLVDGAVARSLTAFHGLPNNHVYAVAAYGGRTYAGTLGGLAEIEGRRVLRVFTTASSRLPHNWVNGLAVLDGRLFVGTYGGGVAALTAGGELVPHEETAGLDVNPGAMLAVDGRLYVGTLAGGAYALEASSGRWTRIATGLGSRNVTAIAADPTYLYFGTENGIARVERAALS